MSYDVIASQPIVIDNVRGRREILAFLDTTLYHMNGCCVQCVRAGIWRHQGWLCWGGLPKGSLQQLVSENMTLSLSLSLYPPYCICSKFNALHVCVCVQHWETKACTGNDRRSGGRYVHGTKGRGEHTHLERMCILAYDGCRHSMFPVCWCDRRSIGAY